MKKLLICVNTVLAFLLAISLWGAFSGSNGDKLEVGKKKKRTKSAAAAVVPTPAKFNVPASEEAVSSIVRKNIFDTQRTGGAAWGRGATYTLVGIYRVNKTQGAIITSKGGFRRGNMPVQQFFRVGDTLPNGYTPCSRATSITSSAKPELTMAKITSWFSVFIYASLPIRLSLKN